MIFFKGSQILFLGDRFPKIGADFTTFSEEQTGPKWTTEFAFVVGGQMLGHQFQSGEKTMLDGGQMDDVLRLMELNF